MNQQWQELIQNKVVVLDGAIGTMLQQRGMPAGIAPEVFCLDQPNVIRQLQTEYLAAGVDIVYTPTFGGNRIKLSNYGLEKKAGEINRRLAEASLKVAASWPGRWVAGDVGPTGLFFEPFGETPLEKGIEIFSEQIQALVSAGVQAIVIETQLDIQEARIALLAAREVSQVPVLVSMTFEEGQKTLTGSDPLTCLNVFQSLGADAFGVNCSAGPAEILPLIRTLAGHAHIPLAVKPNAGLPSVQNGRTVFPMGAKEFAAFAREFHALGVSLVGGCCGTTPEHIRQTVGQLAGLKPNPIPGDTKTLLLSSPRRTVAVSAAGREPICVVGERINPTGKPVLQAELQAGKTDRVKALAREQKNHGAHVLDVNVGAPGVDEKAVMLKAVKELAVLSDLPLCIDSSRPEVIEAAVRMYPGRVLVNSLSGEQAKLDALLPILKRYGCAFIVLPLDDHGISESAEARRATLDRILEHCDHAGVSRQAGVVDGLVLAVSSNQIHAQVTLDSVEYTARTLGLNTILGLSNVSFGMPRREQLNAAYLAMAASRGLSMVIANPAALGLMDAKAAADVLTDRDHGGQQYLALGAGGQPSASPAKPSTLATPAEGIHDAILFGDKAAIAGHLDRALAAGFSGPQLVEQVMVPAIQEVGEKYSRQEFFLPQLIAAAETMEQGMNRLAPQLTASAKTPKGVVVLATVKGDVHDIGKKIVGLLLRNHGYEVIDLGKSVDEHTIVDKALEHHADFIALSALMTTTMQEMSSVIRLVQQRQVPVRIIVGGAVVTQKFADEIKAHGYAADANAAVTLLDALRQRAK